MFLFLQFASAAEPPVSKSNFQSPIAPVKLFEPDGGCVRHYTYKNKTYPADSSRKPDGEGLRKLFKKSPQAEEMLNNYQSRLTTLRWPAITGSIGVASMITGVIYASQLDTQLGRRDTRLVMIGAGASLILASYAYGQLGRHLNEKNLEKAVETYNDSVPKEERIQVSITPTENVSGGMIQTLVPF